MFAASAMAADARSSDDGDGLLSSRSCDAADAAIPPPPEGHRIHGADH
jgi:hypothetical protein